MGINKYIYTNSPRKGLFANDAGEPAHKNTYIHAQTYCTFSHARKVTNPRNTFALHT